MAKRANGGTGGDQGRVASCRCAHCQRAVPHSVRSLYVADGSSSELAANGLPRSLDGDLVADAFRLADEAMVDLLVCHGLPGPMGIGAFRGRVRLVTEDGLPTGEWLRAAPQIHEAFSWLSRRGLAKLRSIRGADVVEVLPP